MIDINTLKIGSVFLSPKRQVYEIKEIKTNDFVLFSWRTGAVFSVAKQKQNAFWKNSFFLYEGMALDIHDKQEVEDECNQQNIVIYQTTKFFINTLDAKNKKIIVSVLDHKMNIDSSISLLTEDFSLLFSPSLSSLGEEPKNNDGREFCFWCKGATIKQGWFFKFHNVCPACKK